MDAKENNVRKYNLEDRTFDFANNCKEFLKTIDKNIHNVEYYKQLIRSSGSVAANFIEANESFSRNDFSHRVKICRKEAKESILWLKLIDLNETQALKRDSLIQEATELMKIFGAILEKLKNTN
ncbi:four helix bundle protein [Mucilaginibacter lappiensis]|uniref:Four helix bundle protein n=1 Tax=Mucilaginibacter lappiensis TaxID=354630 RepID=A0A1N7DU93_9SPHI|nr:four helix bundle protein [Mucilaginibacter lappiensis]MBB6111446.1 four helix bundle protein [Mucilaginibacter lappiensis]MBB6130216.1 four helix bundle protein [Mucilaginibacter lappiensis]SIR79386.1 four helix bundle protein [Mucilaginibacter lappiensis]